MEAGYEGFPPPEVKKAPSSTALYEVTQAKPHEVSVDKATIGARAEETFLRLCSNWEVKEREGRLPEEYSQLKIDDLHKIVISKEIQTIESVNEGIESIEETIGNLEHEFKNSLFAHRSEEEIKDELDYYQKLLAKKLEERQLVEALDEINKHRDQTAIVESENKIFNPLEKIEDGNVDFWFTADFHHAPQDVKKGIRVEAFEKAIGYRLQRRMEKIKDWFLQRKRFANIEEDNVVLRYMITEDVRNLYYQWMEDVIRTLYSSQVDGETPDSIILSDLGDKVHDGAFFGDQLREQTRSYSLSDKITQSVKNIKSYVMEIWGNHDQDSRIPESFEMLTELFGHRVFAQEIGGVLVAAIDTNILNPEWENQFNQRASDHAKELLKKKKQLQEDVLTKMQTYEGPVVILGHNPARIIDSFACKPDEKHPYRKGEIIQNSNVVKIIAGHTHSEDHVVLPFKNKNNGQINMDVIESYIHTEGVSPVGPKLYRLRIRDDQIMDIETYQEPKERFNKRYRELQFQQQLL